jgi:hypothetical protein
MTEENRNEQVAEDESSDEVEDSTAPNITETTEPEVESEQASLGADAIKIFPMQVQAALDYAKENTYEYGPALRDAKITWDVISAESMSDDIVRVRVGFAPVSGFRGDPGVEYMDVDSGGTILARRQVSIPKESKPVALMGIAAFSVVLAVVVISLMTVFKPEGGDPLYVAGRILWIRSEIPVSQKVISYVGNDVDGTAYNWEIRPEDEVNNELVFIKITLINQTSGSVNMVLDEDAAILIDGDRKSYNPINTIERAKTANAASEFNVPGFVPLWGTLVLNTGQQVAGMLVYELPSNSTFDELRWNASDSAIIRYP